VEWAEWASKALCYQTHKKALRRKTGGFFCSALFSVGFEPVTAKLTLMELLTGLNAEAYLTGLVHAKTQVGSHWVDLTVAAVHRLTKRGALDFGGSEYAPASTVAMNTHKRNDDDKYGWWELRHGMYLLHFNEQLHELSEEHVALLTPHPRLTATGANHTSSYLFREDRLSAVLDVPLAGVALKENCRVSRLQVFKTQRSLKSSTCSKATKQTGYPIGQD
jgi:hypothetical protein